MSSGIRPVRWANAKRKKNSLEFFWLFRVVRWSIASDHYQNKPPPIESKTPMATRTDIVRICGDNEPRLMTADWGGESGGLVFAKMKHLRSGQVCSGLFIYMGSDT